MRVFKKIIISLVVIGYNFSFLGNYFQYSLVPTVEAAEPSEKVDIVAIFVDNDIYGGIQGDLSWYTSEYIPKHASNTKALVFPIDTNGFAAKDIHQILENLYFEGEQGVASQLAGVMLLGEVPMPVVELEGRRFVSIFPYTDFVHDDGGPMFVYDEAADLFVYNENPDSLPEVRHSVIPTNDVGLFTKFFTKLREYDASPTDYAKPKIWVDDFIHLKKSYTQQELDRYINQLLFSEADSYGKLTTLFSKVLNKEYEEDLLETVSNAEQQIADLSTQALSDPDLEGDPEVQAAAGEIVGGASTVMDRMDPEGIAEAIEDSSDKPIPTILLEKVLAENFNKIQDVFGNEYVSQMIDNLLAGGRYQMEDIDTSLEKLSFRDTVTKQYLEDINTMLEDLVDDRIYDNEYFLRYPLPYAYEERVNDDLTLNGCVEEEDSVVYQRFENFYKGRNAVDVRHYPDLSITRGSYHNELSITNLWASPLAARGVENLEDTPEFDIDSISVGASYGWLSQQVEQNRAYDFNTVLPDKDLYDTYKCRKKQEVDEFSYVFWGGGSPMNIDPDAFADTPKFPVTKAEFTNFDFAWHPSHDRRIGGPLYDVAGGILTHSGRSADSIDRFAHVDNSSVLATQYRVPYSPYILLDIPGVPSPNYPLNIHLNKYWCDDRRQLDYLDEYTSYEEVDFFAGEERGTGGRGVYKNQISDGGYPGFENITHPQYPWISAPKPAERIKITVHAPLEIREPDDSLNFGTNDLDGDGIPNDVDPDIDGDGIPNSNDTDIDGDGIPNGGSVGEDSNPVPGDPDVNGNGARNGQERDSDSDGMSDEIDPEPFGPLEELDFQREERGPECFTLLRDYSYQLIDTVTKHKNPTNAELDAMSITTLERPIDDPRYVSFKGLGGDLVKFIYPDLYRVKVYEAGKLLDPEQIEANIRLYLTQKVEVYNQYLSEQLSKAPELYAKHPDEYDFLAEVDITATPARSYELLPTDMLIEKLGDKHIRRLAEGLYHLNVGREDERPQADTVGRYIEEARASFDLNRRIEYILDEYLQYDEDDFDFDEIAYPTHIEKGYAYEAGLINSDKFDLSGVGDERERSSPPGIDMSELEVDIGEMHEGYMNQFEDAVEEDTACGVDVDLAVPIVKRPKAFKCWLEKTMRKSDPVKFEVRIEIDRNPETYDRQLEERKNSMGAIFPTERPTDARVAESFAGVPAVGELPEHIDKPVVYGQEETSRRFTLGSLYQGEEQSPEDYNQQAVVDLNSVERARHDEIRKNIQIRSSESPYVVVGEENEAELYIGSQQDLGELTITLSSLGANCPVINGRALCDEELVLSFNPATESQSLPIDFTESNAGSSVLIAEVCDGDVCFQKDVLFHIAPAQLSSLAVSAPASTLPAGATIPISANGYDAFENEVSYSLVPFVMTLSGGHFAEEPGVTEKTITNFKEADFLISTEGTTPGDQLTVTVRPTEESGAEGIETITHTIDLVDHELVVRDAADNEIEQLSYRLPPAEQGFRVRNEDGTTSLRAGALPELSFTIQQPESEEGLSLPIRVRSRSGLLQPGRAISEEGSTKFARDENFFAEEGTVEVLFMPNTQVGSEELEITIPGLPPVVFPVEVLAVGPEDVSISFNKSGDDELIGSVAIKDSRGNAFTEPTRVDLEAWGPVELAETTLEVTGGYQEFTGSVSGGGSCGVRGKAKALPPGSSGDGDSGSDTGSEDGADSGDDGATGSDEGGEDGSEETDGGEGDDSGSEDGGGDGDGDGDGGDDTPSPPNSIDDLTPDEEWYDPSYESFTTTNLELEELLWPQDAPDDDLNIMYMSLFGASWGNVNETTELLRNKKTLAVTTQFDEGGDSAQPPKVASLISPDGRVEDPLDIVKELSVEKGQLTIHLGHDASVGRVILGPYQDFSLTQGDDPVDTDKPHRLIYTPLAGDSSISQNELDGDKIWLNDELLIDFMRGYMHGDVYIRLQEGGGTIWEVRFKNKLIGTLEVQRSGEPFTADQINLYHGSYTLGELPFGSSSNGTTSVAVYLNDHSGSEGDVSLVESVEASINPLKNVGTRHNFSNLTNFAQGMPAAESARHFANPFTFFIGDPFLERVDENKEMTATDYDEGIGQKVFSDTKNILDTDIFDYNADGNKDLLVSYKDGSLRILRNHGGDSPFKDLGMLLVVAAGVREVSVGDVDGDGREDIIVRTNNDKLVAYMNDEGTFDVDPRLICLDITNGDKNVSMARQVYVEDMDGDGKVDIITNADGEIKVFYGGSTADGPNYLSTNPYKCDDTWRDRQEDNMLLVKKFDLRLGGPIQDESLRHWPTLVGQEEDPAAMQYEDSGSEGELGGNPDFEDMSSDEIKLYIEAKMSSAMDPILEQDPNDLLAQGLERFDYVMEVPVNLRPEANKEDEEFFAIPSQEKSTDTPRFEVSKEFTDLNGDDLEPGDLVDVSVTLQPVGGVVGPIAYWEKLSGPWIIYKNEYGKIEPFDHGDLPEDVGINWNIGQNYQFLLHGLTLTEATTFSYTVQYDGKKDLVDIEIETNYEEMFVGPRSGPVLGGMVDTAHAQGGWEHRIRTYPAADGCYKKYRMFSPGEEEVTIADYLDEKTDEYTSHFDDARDEANDQIKQSHDLDGMRDMMGLTTPSIELRYKVGRTNSLELDAGATYLNYFVDELREKVENWGADAVGASLQSMGLFEDYQFGYERCQGIKFGKNSCGQGLPIPFNMAFLAPGTYNIMGCKPDFIDIPKIFPDDAGVPIIAFPTDSAIPVWIPSPSGAGGLFGGNTSQFRMYLSPTLTNGLGLALCFGPYDVGMDISTPVGDVGGNCLVIAGAPLLGGQCTGGGPTDEYVIEEEQRDAKKIGVCNQKEQAASPFVSDALGGQVAMGGSPRSVQSTLLSLDQTYLKGGQEFDLKIESGDGKGLVQCIVNKRVEKQIRYFANNALNMHLYVLLPQMDDLTKNIEKVRFVDALQSVQFDRENTQAAFQEVDSPGTTSEDDSQKSLVEKIALPRSVLGAVSEDVSNPFDLLGDYFNNIPLINLEEKRMSIQIPYIYQEDLARYDLYLKSWVERNERILKEREKQAETNPVDSNILSEMEQTVGDVKRNISTLQQYRMLPQKLSALIHAYDQYIIEIYTFVESFITELTGRLQVNANRFSQRVDFVVLLVGIIETWQILIDFSVDRSTKCAKCRQDNYDFYSCKLSLLCVDLPILPIPNFHLPDIYLDFSDVKIGLDIIVPRFNFVPRKVELIQLPDLPQPAPINVDVDLPSIPRLPQPPPLPELPELEMELDISLPNLPPAPRVPKISPAIEVIVELADFIGSIYCIFKSGIGLVAEQGVKTRIEQMTQRKQDIFPFDSLEITLPESPVRGYDYKLESHIDLKFDFRVLYEALEGVVDKRHSKVDNAFTNVRKIRNYEEIIGPTIEQAKDEAGILDDADFNFDLNGSTLDENYLAYEKSRKSTLVGGTVQEVEQHLIDSMAYFLSRSDLAVHHRQAEKVQGWMRMDHNIQPNTEGVEQVGEEVLDDIDALHDEANQMQYQLENDYDQFLDSLPEYNLVADESTTKTYEVSLFNGNQETIDLLNRQEAPRKRYIDMHRPLVEGYANTLQEKSHYELDMNQLEHNELETYFTEMQVAYAEIDGTGVEPPTPTASNNQQSTLEVDFTQYIKGFFVPGDDGDYHNVIAWDKGDKFYSQHAFEVDDINGDGNLDIFLIENNTIYVKYGKQDDSYPGGNSYSTYHEIGPFTSMEQLREQVEPDNGYYEVGGSRFKIWDHMRGVRNFVRHGHNFDTMAFSWENDPSVDAYLLQVADRVGVNHDKNWDDEGLSYVVVLPTTMTGANLQLEVPEQLRKGTIENYLDSGKIKEVIYYDGTAASVQVLFDEWERKWWYTQVAQLDLEKEAGGGGGFLSFLGLGGSSEPEYTLTKIGPWTRQRLAGTQNLADDQLPTWDIQLIRNINGDIQGEGSQLQGYINTSYTLEGVAEDNGEVVESWLVYSGNVIKHEEGDTITLDDLDYTYAADEQFLFVAVDQAGNMGQTEVDLHITIPELEIDEIIYESVGAEIVAKLSHDIDYGQVRFEKNRHGFREPLDPALFPVKPLDPEVKGGLYPFDKQIDLLNEKGEKVATADTQTAQINISEEQADQYETSVSVNESGQPEVQLVDKSSQQSIFTVQVESQQLVGGGQGCEVRNGGYTKVQLEEFAGEFENGWCIRPHDDECHIFVSAAGEIYIPEPFRHDYELTYRYDEEQGYAVYDITNQTGQPIATIRFTPQPLN